jgi:hypothetical protein
MTKNLKSFLFLTVFLNAFGGLSQTKSIGEQRLLEVYGEKMIELESQNAEKFAFLEFSAEYGYKIVDKEAVKADIILPLDEVKMQGSFDQKGELNPKNLNPLLFNFNHNPSIRNYYSIADSGKILICLSFDEVNKLFEESKK